MRVVVQYIGSPEKNTEFFVDMTSEFMARDRRQKCRPTRKLKLEIDLRLLFGLLQRFDQSSTNELADWHARFLGPRFQRLLQGGFHLNNKTIGFHMDILAQLLPYLPCM